MEIALKIENLLRTVNPQYEGMRGLIEKNPYHEVVEALRCRIPEKKLQKFELYYNAIDGQSIEQLTAENYDLDGFVAEIENMVDTI